MRLIHKMYLGKKELFFLVVIQNLSQFSFKFSQKRDLTGNNLQEQVWLFNIMETDSLPPPVWAFLKCLFCYQTCLFEELSEVKVKFHFIKSHTLNSPPHQGSLCCTFNLLDIAVLKLSQVGLPNLTTDSSYYILILCSCVRT